MKLLFLNFNTTLWCWLSTSNNKTLCFCAHETLWDQSIMCWFGKIWSSSQERTFQTSYTCLTAVSRIPPLSLLCLISRIQPKQSTGHRISKTDSKIKNLKLVEKFSSLYGDTTVETSNKPRNRFHMWRGRRASLFIVLILFNVEIVTLIEKSSKSK